MMAIKWLRDTPQNKTPADQIVHAYISRLQTNIVASRMNIHISLKDDSGIQDRPGVEEKRNRWPFFLYLCEKGDLKREGQKKSIPVTKREAQNTQSDNFVATKLSKKIQNSYLKSSEILMIIKQVFI